MATIRQEIVLEAPAARVWDAVRDFGAVHTRVAPGFVVDCTLEADARVVTFANGTSARELLVDLDDENRRLVYAVRSERVVHYNASVQVAAEDPRGCRVIWIVDVLPNEIAGYIRRQMDEAARAMQATLERA
jgi:carbon monoxide dehydrogenase subunit G